MGVKVSVARNHGAKAWVQWQTKYRPAKRGDVTLVVEKVQHGQGVSSYTQRFLGKCIKKRQLRKRGTPCSNF